MSPGRPARAVVLTPGIAGADGISEVSRMIVRALGSLRMTLDVVSLGDPPRAGSGVDGLPAARFFGAKGGKLRFGAAALRAALTGMRPAEVVCCHLHLATVGVILAAARGARLSVFLHGIEAWKPLGAALRFALGHAGLIIANSDHTGRRFSEANSDLSALPIHVCPLGVGKPNGGGTAEPEPDGEPGPFALIVGRMAIDERYKGHDLLLDIWPRVLAEIPEARLVVVGDGDDRARLEARATALGDRVRFTARVSTGRLAALYRQCAFFVMPSREEGFGLVFLEAMRAGKACIGGAGAAAEVIEDRVTGLVVNPESPDEVRAAVVRLFREPETRAGMGRAGALRVARDFTEAHFRRRFGALLGFDGNTA